jgi:hypothetical protein
MLSRKPTDSESLTTSLLQLTGHLGKVEGEKVFEALHTANNQDGEVRAMTFTPTKAHDQFIPVLAEIPRSLSKYGHGDTELMFTDNVRADKAELEHAFPALLKNVFPVPSSSLEPLVLPRNVVHTLRTTFLINNRINTIMETLNDIPPNKSIRCVVDFEWSVDVTTGIYGRVALISLECQKNIYLIPVSQLPYFQSFAQSFLDCPLSPG